MSVAKFHKRLHWRKAYDHATVDAHDKVKPWLNDELEVCVAEHLKAERAVVFLGRRRSIAVETGNKPIECIKHPVEF
jgi:hypothetical protein